METRPKQPSTKGPAAMFVGDVWYDVIAAGAPPLRLGVNLAASPPARTPRGTAMWESLAGGQDGPETEWADHLTDEEYPGR